MIDKYLILDKLGAGGMGMVFRPLHRRIKRVVALKVLPPSFAKDETAVRRFHREAEAAAKVSHPNVVAVLDADEFNGAPFLRDGVQRRQGFEASGGGPRPPSRPSGRSIASSRRPEGWEPPMPRGIYHRDIKPFQPHCSTRAVPSRCSTLASPG